ncbi:MAG: hypothetical protein JNK11_19100 [Alphaproteobacteria bacterium]|nr:hypothetical protein [Alphaproteobacteria bacterium]
MSVLTQQQTTQAVRGLIYFGAHSFSGDMNLGDCGAVITSKVSPLSPPTTDKGDPVDELVEVSFTQVRYQQHAIEGSVHVIAKIRWPTLSERLRMGSPNFGITEQPQVKHDKLTRNCLVAFARIITKHADEVRRVKEQTDEKDDDKDA